MPKTILDYGKTIMYKIVCKELTIKDCYIGHTTNMTKRKAQHKFSCNNEKDKSYNLKIYKIIRQNGGWDNWTMILVEEFPCKDKYQACKRERELYEELGAFMNTYRPYRTQEEHKEEQKQCFKQYCEDHKEEIKEYKKKYGKQYYQDHKEQRKEQDKQRYQKNKEEIIEKYKEKIQCEFCSKLLSKGNMTRHHKICKSKPKEEN